MLEEGREREKKKKKKKIKKFDVSIGNAYFTSSSK